jgi:hypothetical protein
MNKSAFKAGYMCKEAFGVKDMVEFVMPKAPKAEGDTGPRSFIGGVIRKGFDESGVTSQATKSAFDGGYKGARDEGKAQAENLTKRLKEFWDNSGIKVWGLPLGVAAIAAMLAPKNKLAWGLGAGTAALGARQLYQLDPVKQWIEGWKQKMGIAPTPLTEEEKAKAKVTPPAANVPK